MGHGYPPGSLLPVEVGYHGFPDPKVPELALRALDDAEYLPLQALALSTKGTDRPVRVWKEYVFVLESSRGNESK